MTSCLSDLSMPANLISLCQCNNIEPFDEFLVAADKLECISSSAMCTEFRLNARAFDTGSMLTTRDHLQALKVALYHLHYCDRFGPSHCDPKLAKRQQHFAIRASPVANLKWSPKMRSLAGIPPEADLFCFASPVRNLSIDELKECLRSIDKDEPDPDGNPPGERWPDGARMFTDPFVLFLTTGGFMFFDKEYKIVSILALSFAEQVSDRLCACTTKLFCGRPTRPKNLPHTAIRPLFDCGRWEVVTVQAMRAFGFTHFAWIKPFEFIGDHVFTEYGGFAYLNMNEWRTSQYFPVVGPELGDSNKHEPKEYDAPLHIPELELIGFEEDQEYEAALETLDLSPAIVPTIETAREAMIKQARKANLLSEQEQTESEFGEAFQVVEHWIETRLSAGSKLVDFEMENLTTSSDLVMASGNQSTKVIENQLGFSQVADLLSYESELLKPETLTQLKSALEAELSSEEWQELKALICSAEIALKQWTDVYNQSQAGTEDQAQRQQHRERHQCRAVFVEVLKYISLKKHMPLSEKKKHLWNVNYVLFEERCCGTQVDASNDGTGKAVRDEGRTEISLSHFVQQPQAKHCSLLFIEVASLRFYTTTSYTLINGPLRQINPNDATKEANRQHPLAITTYYITSSLKKLRANNFRTAPVSKSSGFSAQSAASAAAPGSTPEVKQKLPTSDGGNQSGITGARSYLWRGMKDRTINEHFLMYGGSELGCMSTSENIAIVARYARSNNPLLLRIKIESPMDRGANLKWLSVYPSEDEVLYPPLT